VDNRRPRRHLIALVTAPVAIVLVAAVAILVLRGPATATAAVDPPVPTSCTAEQPAEPEGTADGSHVHLTKVDPTGRYLIGDADPPTGFDSRAVLWIDGVPSVLLPDGASRSGTIDVNRSGTVLGRSSVGDVETAQSRRWVYRDGEFTDLAGPDDVAPIAINESGVILGQHSERAPWDNSEAGLIVSRPFVWRSPQQEPEALPLPDGVDYAKPIGIDDDGTIVAVVQEDLRDGGKPARLLVWVPGAQAAEEVTAPPEFAGQWRIVGGRGGWITAMLTATSVVVWNYLRETPAVTVPSDTANEGGIPNASGWFGLWRQGKSQLWVGGDLLDLPGFDSTYLVTPYMASDDGHVIIGEGRSNDPPYLPPVVWHCS
jgi:uncharacterized membrane protein